MRRPPILPQSFYARDALELAHALLGQELHVGEVALRITEVEAYRHPDDSANHCRMGRTRRNAPMWGPPGHAYVYLCYGVHSMLNLVAGLDGEGTAVLVRACEPVRGHAQIVARRGGRAMGPGVLDGPGKVAAALGLDTTWSGHALFRPGGLTLRRGVPPSAVLEGPRIGIGYATPEHQEAPWRLASADSAFVGHKKALRPAPIDPRRPSRP